MGTLGSRLAQAMDVRGMTPADLVRLHVLSKAAIYFWLDDTAKPDKVRADSVAKVCKALRINREWLLSGRGKMDAETAPESQSQPARLTGEIIISAYQEAVAKYTSIGLNATSFRPFAVLDHAELLALALIAHLTEPESGTDIQVEVEVGRGATGKDRTGSGSAGKDRAAEAGGESGAETRKRKERAA